MAGYEKNYFTDEELLRRKIETTAKLGKRLREMEDERDQLDLWSDELYTYLLADHYEKLSSAYAMCARWVRNGRAKELDAICREVIFAVTGEEGTTM